MEVKIGVQQANRELVIDVDEKAEDLEARVAQAVSESGLLSITDAKGRTLLVPASRLAYVEIGSGTIGQVGFRS